MRPGWTVLTVAALGCGHAGTSPKASLCTETHAEAGACLAMAKDRLARKDDDGAKQYVERLVMTVSSSQACLRDNDPAGCFAGIVGLLRDHPVGLLAQYDLPDDLLVMVPRWTGSEETGPVVQARDALAGMCKTPGHDPVAQQRACLVLGDLVDDQRTRRCGFDCDVHNKDALSGWSTADVIDGYAEACKVVRAKSDPQAQAAFVAEVSKTYQVTAATDPVCGVASSSLRGASIPGALATKDRIKNEAKQREQAAQTAAKREAERLAAMEKSKADASTERAAAETLEFNKAIAESIHRSDWATTYGLLTKRRGSPVDDASATALNTVFVPFTEWASAQTSVPAAYLELSSRLALAPKNHAIRVSLATFRDQALAVAKKDAKKAQGVGGTWLHAALVARIAGPAFAEEAKAAADAYAKLVATARTSLVVESLAPACASLVPPSVPGGRTVKAKSTLVCTIEPEHTETIKEPFKVKQHVVDSTGERDVEQETTVDVTHRTFKVVVHGVLAIYSGAPRKAVPIDVEEIVDDTDGSDTRTFDASLAAAKEIVQKATVGAIEDADAAKAYAAGQAALKVGRTAAAENHLVVHALLQGGSAELDDIMLGYGVTFGELLQQK